MSNILNEWGRSWSRNPGLQIASLLVLTASFSLLVSSFLVSKNFFAILTQWGDSSSISVYLRDNADQSEVLEVAKKLKENSEFENVVYLSKEEAVESFTTRFSHLLPDLVDDPEIHSVLPASFEAKVVSTITGGIAHDFLKKISTELKSFAAVEAVTFGEDWLQDYAIVLKIVRVIGVVFAGILFVGTLFITGNVIRSSIYSRREEIEVLELIGATPSMIRRPFVIEGVFLGAISMGLALCLSFSLYHWTQSYISQQLAFSGLSGNFVYFSLGEIIALIGSGILLGAIGSYFTAKNLNSGWLASEA